jgi:energy-coupling factor transport system ATP-binding protein
MGANGAGKTTLCRLVTALAPQHTGGELSGRLTVLGHDSSQVEPAALAGRVGVTFQEVEHQLFNATVEAEVAWGLEALGMPPDEMARRLQWALEVVGLDVDLSRSPASLSGGQQRRLALAVALASRPELLVLDEPVGGLDPAGAREVLDALAALRQETRAAILMTESNPEAVLALADEVAVLADGQVAADGPPDSVFARADMLGQLGVAVPQLARLAAGLNAKLETDYSFLTLDAAEQALVMKFHPQGSAPPVSGRQAEDVMQVGGSGPPALSFKKVAFSYPSGPPVLHEIELGIPAGQFVALIGANGSGKTTLAKHTIGLLRPEAGAVWVNGEDAAGLPVGQLAQRVGFLFQQPERQIFASTVWEELAFGPRNLGLQAAVVEERVSFSLAYFALTELADTPPAVLSYALRRLVTLASLAAMEPAILVLDEPTVGLDAQGWAVTLDWVEELHADGRTVLLVTHDMRAAARAERAIVLTDGRIIADAPPAKVFRQPELLARAALEPPPVAALAKRLGLPAEVLDVETALSALN